MPSDTFAAGIEAVRDVLGSGHRKASKSPPGLRIRILSDTIREADMALHALTPTASEATAIGAGETDARLARLSDRLNHTGDLRISRTGAAHEISAIRAALAASPTAGDTDTAISAGGGLSERALHWRLMGLAATLRSEEFDEDNSSALDVEEAARRLTASPKPDTDTPVDPGVEGVRSPTALANQFIPVVQRGLASYLEARDGGRSSSMNTALDYLEVELAEIAFRYFAKPGAGMVAGKS